MPLEEVSKTSVTGAVERAGFYDHRHPVSPP